MARRKSTKPAAPKSLYPKSVQRLITTCYYKKMNSHATASRINESATAQKLGVSYDPTQIRTTFGNITRQRCGWFQYK
jgi:hypothetical protein